MRKIKFRGMDINGNWHYGLVGYKSTALLPGGKTDWFISDIDGTPWAYQVRPETIGQCTGLKDKNGKLIYEGDIVKTEVKEPEIKVIGIITFGRYLHDLGFYVNWKRAPAEARKYYPGWRKDLFYWIEEEVLEVIGNIHENPELLGE